MRAELKKERKRKREREREREEQKGVGKDIENRTTPCQIWEIGSYILHNLNIFIHNTPNVRVYSLYITFLIYK